VTDHASDLRTDLVVRRFGLTPTAGAPTLLLLHGLTGSGQTWPEAVRHWQDDYAIVAVDQRGHGESPRFTRKQLAGHPGDVMVDDAVGLLEQLDRPVVVGHSLGGAVALAAAVRRPELVRVLVLEDPASLAPGEPQRSAHGGEVLEGLRPSIEAPDDRALLAARRREHPSWQESELLASGRSEQQVDAAYLAHGDLKPSPRWDELFERVEVPTLVVSGDDPGAVCVDEAMERGLREIGNPRVTLVRVPSAGHCIRRERPASFHDVVDTWLSGRLDDAG
jgi:pimeloyl-ACP methyl ester carboxylesterase